MGQEPLGILCHAVLQLLLQFLQPNTLQIQALHLLCQCFFLLCDIFRHSSFCKCGCCFQQTLLLSSPLFQLLQDLLCLIQQFSQIHGLAECACEIIYHADRDQKCHN